MNHRVVLSSQDIERALKRIAHEILEANEGSGNLVLLGIPTRGVPLANRLTAILREIEPGYQGELGTLDITMYRDDLSDQEREIKATLLPATGITDKVVVLVDDVLFSGRTIRAALDALSDFGRPQQVKLAALIDRGHRELPIRPDFVGKNIPTAKSERVTVQLVEQDDIDQVVIG
ncbi:bifunctional pyr operon transcriptional regulator/uracil phosphoribosyltransferase PyrR [Candidatus Aquiluna sp. UB-MaderosW2red]|uniref:bifunctional pyr operon transcriptional regulator/uracil phosphoribosyltransferase PyrR n=1 Tax=Candidatus Aquiluna sp. UB-MaderosW2red TaxID=1855377 RepID=UPI000875CF05|nr:bifunctional pyr operon transcriptional regulator/uracil phosphoribosyltransferase PyrR [Candidatus Aquiluna sp. UB-MaderosW2red]SCX11620.1 pyrimidine operon attenuation protein / uracil phosphoribosyltransferase [Candidatus Aquiluna sp. UB-MaderosW2red]